VLQVVAYLGKLFLRCVGTSKVHKKRSRYALGFVLVFGFRNLNAV
jgi:hypothetical protein